MRIYVAATLPLLARARESGLVASGGSVVFAVTPALREWYVEGDLEELEYAAMAAAARESLTLVAADPQARARRVVLAADVSEAWLRPFDDALGMGRGELAKASLTESVPWKSLAAVHVDGYEAEAAVAAAVAALPNAVNGDEDAQFVVDSAEDESLLWYAVQEADDLLRGLAGNGGEELTAD